MSGRGLRAAGVVSGALALLAGCTLSSHSGESAAAPAFTGQAPPPIGSVEHPRPVQCIDGLTYAVEGTATPTAPTADRSPTAGPGDVSVGPLAWRDLRDMATGRQTAYGSHNSDGWHYRIGPDLRPGAVVTVTVGAQQRARAGLEYGGGYGTTPAPAVTFHSCPGAATTFPGGFFVAGDGRACIPLDVQVGDGASKRIVISLFNGSCPSA